MNRLNWQCCLAGSSKMAPRILIFSIAMGADYSIELISIENYAPQFIGYNNIFLECVSSYFFIKTLVKCCALFAWSFSILLWTGPSNQVRGKSLFLYNVPQRPIIKIRNQKWYFVTKIVLTYCEKKCSSDWEKLLKFEVEGRAFAKFLRSLIQQFIQIVKGQNNFW